MTQSTRYYLEQQSTQAKGEKSYNEVRTGKLKLNTYNLSQDVTNESPTYYSDEQEAKQIATVLNLYSKLFKLPTYVDVFKEEVKVSKVTDNDPRPKPDHKAEIEETSEPKEVSSNVEIAEDEPTNEESGKDLAHQ